MTDIRMSHMTGIPFGNNAGRPAGQTGQPYFNGETARLELYTSNNSWENIVQEVPGVSSITGQYLESNQSNSITIFGTNFVSGAAAYAIGSDAIQVAATSTTFNSLVQLTATFTGLTSANEPYDIKVVNPSNLFGILPDALYVNNILTWQTSAGSLGTFGDNVSISVSATATDDSTITYSLASGSSLPAGITLNSSTGLISGTTPDVSANTTYTFTINASDGSNPAVPRTFSFIVNAAPTWLTTAGSLGTFTEQDSINIQLQATDPTDNITYSVASGSSLPSGISIGSSTGIISGTLPDISSNTTYNFTINASDGINTVSRAFSITSNYAISFEYLMTGGGGGGGGGYNGAGGGAGGLLYGTLIKTPGLYNISIGSAGLGASNGFEGSNGGDTSAFSLIAYGGGKGAGEMQNMSASGQVNATGGGSAGGRGHPTYQSSNSTPAVSGQGNIGGTGTSCCSMGGGGGFSSVGGDVSGSAAGSGGSGLLSSITGTSLAYAGGGGGGNRTGGSGGSGGSGVGGNGGSNGSGSNASSYGSGGGGGGGSGGVSNGGNGSSGVLIIAYPSTNPALTISGGLTYDQPSRSGYRVYRITAGSGTITIP